MPGTPFFRGVNRLDWLYALELHTAFDRGSDALARQVAGSWGLVSYSTFAPAGSLTPPVAVAVCTDYVFVLSGSTRQAVQWVGNVLGSAAVPISVVPGSSPAYFLSVAFAQYTAIRSAVLAAAPGRRVVLIGFSLGGAAATLLKSLLQALDSVQAACIVFASPRPGDAAFAASYPTSDFQRAQFNADVVPAFPPTTWAGTGLHAGWVPYAPFVTYQHIAPGHTLYSFDEIRAGDQLPDLVDVVLGFSSNLYQQFHQPGLYASIIRAGLPDTLADGDDGHPAAGDYDSLAPQVFFTPSPWPWLPARPLTSEVGMIQVSFSIRNKSDKSVGFNEVYYFPGSDPQAVLDSLLASSSSGGSIYPSIAIGRTSFLTRSCELWFIRSSLVGPPRQSVPFAWPQPIQGQVASSMTDIADCITYQALAQGGSARRFFHFRGIGESWLNASQLTDPGAKGQTLILSFLNGMLQRGMRLFSPATLWTSPIAGVNKAAVGAPCVLQLDTPTTAIANTVIEISGVRKTPLLRGRWLTTGTGGAPANTLTVAGSEWLSPNPTTTGKVIGLGFPGAVGWQIRSFVFKQVGSKKTGHSGFLRRGRQSKKISHR